MCFSLLILALAGLALIEVNEAKDFHTFRQVTVHLADPKKANQKVADSSSDSNGLHIDGLNLQIFEAQNLLFDIDLLLNYDLLPQKYFQKYHRQVRMLSFLTPLVRDFFDAFVHMSCLFSLTGLA